MAYKFVEDNEITESSDEINITENFEEKCESFFNENRKMESQDEPLDLSLKKIQNEPLNLSLPKSSTKVKFLFF